MKMNKKYSENLEEIDSLSELLGILIVAIIIIGIIFGVLGLVCCGVINCIFFICGINATFTYTQGLVMALVAKGIGVIIRQIIKIKDKE